MEKTDEKTEKTICGIRRKTWLLCLWFAVTPIWQELWLRVSSSGETQPFLSIGLVLMPLSLLAIYALLFAAASLLPKKWRFGVTTGILGIGSLICMVQTVYYKIFNMYLVLFSVRAAGTQGINDYKDIALHGILSMLPYILLEAVPLVLWCIFAWRLMKTEETKKRESGFLAAVGAGLYAVFFAVLALLPRGGVLPPWNLYWYALEDISAPVRDFGAINSMRLDIKYQIFGTKVAELEGESNMPQLEGVSTPTMPSEVMVTKTTTQPTATGTGTASAEKTTSAAEPTKPTTPAKPVTPNTTPEDQVMDLDFAALAKNEKDADVKMLHEYFGSLNPSKTNAYTGLFKGKNVIMITAESFYSFAVDKELTPTLYKMAHEGLEFKNYYTPVWGVSTLDGEYVNLLGTIPKSGVWSLWRARQNNLYFTLGNVGKRAGYKTIAYHNGTYDYYDRDESHFNLGYDKWIAINSGLELPHDTWPNSDIEMIDATTADYLKSDDPFSIYYLTISGHAPHTFVGSSMATKNKELVANMPYSDEVKAYMAAEIELDRAMELLLKRLEEAGKLDDTLIVLAADHYPYGLSESSLNEMLGKGYDKNFELYRNTLMIYNPNFTHVEIEKPCYAVDILPTVLNLMGEEYDSRLLVGSDILSSSPGLVVFVNRSWISDIGRYNSVTDTFTPNKGVTVPDGYVDSVNAVVAKKFTVSTLILDKDYYGKLFGHTQNQP